MSSYIIKSVSLDKEVNDYICDRVDGKDEEKKNFSRAFNHLVRSHIAMEKELKLYREKHLIENDKEPERI